MKKNKNKELSSRGRAESSDVVISCDKKLSFLARCGAFVRQGIFEFGVGDFIAQNAAAILKTKEAAHRVTDVTAPEQGSLDEVTRRAPRGMTIPTLALAAVLSIGGIGESWAIVDGGTCGNGCNWSYDTETKEFTLSGNGTMDSFIPASSHDPFVLPWGNYIADIVTISVDGNSTIDNISDRAFYGATSLVSAYLPNVKTIGYDAFYGATSLIDVDIPSVTSIDSNAFGEAKSLNSINMPNVKTIYEDAFENATSLSSIDLPNLQYIDVSNLNGTFFRIPTSTLIGSGSSSMDASSYFAGMSCTIDNGYYLCYNCGNKHAGNGSCFTCDSGLIQNGACVDSCSEGYAAKGKNCVSGCGDWYAEDDGQCVPDYETDEAGNIIIDDDAPEITEDIFGLSSGMPEKILCRGDVAKCKEILHNYPIYSGGGNPYGYGSSDYYPGYSAPYGGEYLNVDLGDYVEPATEANCESGRYYWSGSSCNNKSGGINCDENFKQMETWCNRIRYTPADAAKVLKDTDNEIVMTFKVNR